MTTEGNVAIFGDFDTCTPTYNSTGYSLVEGIRRVALNFGNVTLFKAYLEVDYAHPSFSARSLELRTELQASGVSLTDCPSNSACNILNQMLAVDLILYATDHAGPNTTILLISASRGLAYALASLRLRNQRVVLVSPSNAHPSLLAQVRDHIDWNTEILGQSPLVEPPPPTRPPSTRPPTRSRGYSFATTGYTPSGSKHAYTTNEIPLDGQDSEDDDFYMEDPTLLNSTPYMNSRMNGNRRSESPVAPWSERPPLNPLRSRSDSRAYSPAMSFRSAKTSILTSPSSHPVEVSVGAGEENSRGQINGVNGASPSEVAGPADPIEPLFTTAPESIVPIKPSAANNSTATPLVNNPTPPVIDSYKGLETPGATSAPQLATPNVSNEPSGQVASDKAPSAEAIAAKAPPPVIKAIIPAQDPAATPALAQATPGLSTAQPATSTAPATQTKSAVPPPKPASTSALATPAPPPKPQTPAPAASKTTTKPSTLSSSAPTFVSSTTPKPQSQPAKSAPAHWKVLIDVLEERRRLLGQAKITRSEVGTGLSKYKPKAVYASAGVSNFGAWIKQAEEAGIVETGGTGNSQWISLRPEWVSTSLL